MTTITGTDGNDVLNVTESATDVFHLSGDDSVSVADGVSRVELYPNAGNDTVDFEGGADLSINYTDLFSETDAGAVDVQFTGSLLTVDKGAQGTDIFQNFSTEDFETALTVFLGAGDDTITVDYGTATPEVFLQVLAGAGDNRIVSEGGQVRASYRFDDAVLGGITYTATGDARLTGTVTGDGLGTNTLQNVREIEGSRFADSFTGGAGDERFITGGGDDTIDGGDGYDLIRFDRSGMEAVTVDIEAGTATGIFREEAFAVSFSGIERIEGSREGDRLRGSSEDDYFDADEGDDFVVLGDGNDVVRGEEGNDTVFAGSGDLGDDYIEGNDGDDVLGAGAGNDFIRGGDGSDLIFGGAGGDRAEGESGSDTIWAGLGDDDINGGTGNDTVGGGGGMDTIRDEDGNDVIYAGADTDDVDGGAGDDLIFGGSGDDFLAGGAGDDELYGGAGNDLFVFGAGHGDDNIGGFTTLGTNLIDLTGLGLSGFEALTVSQVATDVLVLTGQGSITLWNTDQADISGSDFLF